MLDEVVQKVVALGVPGLVLVVLIGMNGYAGAVAVTVALTALGGPWGYPAGIVAFGLMTLVADAIARLGIDAVAKAVVDGLLKKGMSQQQLIDTIYGVPSIILSKRIKEKCKSYIYG